MRHWNRIHTAAAGIFCATLITGCPSNSSDTSADTAASTDANPAIAGPESGGMAGGVAPTAAPAGQSPAGGNGMRNPQAAKSAADSWETVARQIPGFPAPAAAAAMGAGAGMGGGSGMGGPAGAVGKPAGVVAGTPAAKARQDPFESFVKFVVPEIPAYTLALPRRLAPPYVPPAPKEEGDPNLIKGPLPPLPRRVAGVMYNGAITAILETGDANGAVQHDVIRPGSVVPFGIAGQPDLTVESITMSALVLRAPDGRSVEVKLSGLPPAVADALRGQFANPGAGGGAGMGAAGGGMNMGGGGGGGGGNAASAK